MSDLAAGVGLRRVEQFTSIDQQRRAGMLGMWGWLLTELLLFAGLFLIAIVLRVEYPQAVSVAVSHLKFWIGAANTAVLIVSSLTMSAAIVLSRMGQQRPMLLALLATAALGALFLGLKGFEYVSDYVENLTPFLDRPYALAGNPHTILFVDLYWVTTGLHAFHLVTGIGILLGLTWQARAPGYLGRHQNRIEVFGLYWHFIDLIWILVFPTLYLIGRSAA